MDKELLRIVIISLGVTVMVCMVVWSIFKNRKPKGRVNFYNPRDPLGKIDDSLVINTEHDDFDVIPLSSSFGNDDIDDPLFSSTPDSHQYEYEEEEEYEDESDYFDPAEDEELLDEVEEAMVAEKIIDKHPVEKVESPKVPSVIQISILALEYDGFNGQDLLNVFKKHGLEYGSLKVFERLDAERQVDYTVASMVEPGTFPDKNMELFYCPGIVFFFQPDQLSNPIKVFDQFIQVISEIAVEIEGVELDHKREPLSKEVIMDIRRGLLR